ncbi:ABC transporter ATP-binding protein [Glaciibacter superstes]|uniref:ABC transporter ATP-binding protein n=1 Tax=Glaciibacter superstes TaxID=501023 RepID=UPI0003B7B4C4|nr:ABC transporter ATP-binding protein [Glaciibacter superstes]
MTAIDLEQSSSIVFDAATKVYAGQPRPAVDNLSLTIEAGQLCCIVGPSGGGKTTTLLLVNRLVELTSGDIRIGEQSIHDIDPIALRRSIGYVIQQTGLFPHLTIAENIALIPQILNWDKARIRKRTNELLELVGLAPVETFAKRYPHELSGGQQQRVGIARALAANPPVMLMDEPFGALDPITRANIQDEFLSLKDEIGKTTIFITHDIDEAIKMGDKMAILQDGGVLAQYGTPEAILSHPANEFVERFVGEDRGLKLLTLRTLQRALEQATNRPVLMRRSEIQASNLPRIPETATMQAALSLALNSQSTAVIVTSENGLDAVELSVQRLVELGSTTTAPPKTSRARADA